MTADPDPKTLANVKRYTAFCVAACAAGGAYFARGPARGEMAAAGFLGAVLGYLLAGLTLRFAAWIADRRLRSAGHDGRSELTKALDEVTRYGPLGRRRNEE